MAGTELQRDGRDSALVGAAGLVTVGVILWAAGAASAWITGHRVPGKRPFAGLAAFANFGDPSRAWHGPVGPVGVYWTVTAMVLVVPCLLAWLTWRALHGGARCRGRQLDRVEGMATRRHVVMAAGSKALLARAGTLRSSLAKPAPADVGYLLGRSFGVGCWASVEDSILLLGPPRSGKGTSVVIPMILDAPGPVLTTSTRPDNVAVTLAARRRRGPVAVFDPPGAYEFPGVGAIAVLVVGARL